MTSNSNWWPEVEFARPDPPRPTPGHWDLVPARSSVAIRLRGRFRRPITVVLRHVSGSSEMTVPSRGTTCVVVVDGVVGGSSRRRERAFRSALRRADGALAVFQGRRLMITPSGELRVDGMLTVGGVTDRLCVTVSRHVLSVGADGAERLVFTAEASLDRRMFDLAGMPRHTGRTVRVRMRGEFVRARTA
jgi:hypothetical protein